jgi:hypothetical protein
MLPKRKSRLEKFRESTMPILKLKEAGDSAFLTIATAEVVQGEYGKQVRFDSTDGNTLYVPESSVERQLERLQYELPETVGMTLKFSRAASNKQGAAPYWNIDVSETPKKNGGTPKNEKQSDEPTKRTNGHTDKPTLDDLVHSYGECLAAAVNQYKPWLESKGVTPDANAVARMAATIFIERNRRGI